MVEVNLFHFRDRNTFLNLSHPLAKIFTLLLLSSLLAQAHLLRLLLIFGLFCSVAISLRIPLGQYRRELRFFLIMGIIIGLAQYLNTHHLKDTLRVTLRFATVVLMGILFTDTTAPDDLSRAIGSTLEPIPKIPGYRIGATIELTLATIPLLFDVAHQVFEARKARNESIWRRPVRRIVSYISAVFTLLLEKAEDLEIALKARNYNPDAKRDTIAFSYRDLILVSFTISFALFCFLFT